MEGYCRTIRVEMTEEEEDEEEEQEEEELPYSP